jgi:hypothetical protein
LGGEESGGGGRVRWFKRDYLCLKELRRDKRYACMMESRGNQGTLKPSLGGRGSRQLVEAAFMNQDHAILKTASNSRPPN